MTELTPFAKILCAMYCSVPKRCTLTQLQTFLAAGRITQEEYDYIIAYCPS